MASEVFMQLDGAVRLGLGALGASFLFSLVWLCLSLFRNGEKS